MQLSPTGLAAYTLPHTGLQPFLSLPYAGVYTLPDNSVQGCLGAAGNRTNHPSSSLQETVSSFPFLVLPLPAPPHTFRLTVTRIRSR